MRLGDFEILPGVVIVNEDPQNQGRVKACAPGLFDTSAMTEDDIMWISPFMMVGNQTFSKQDIGSKIWILHNVSNYFEYWYIPMFEINSNSPEITSSDSDIILARSINGETIQVYYSREEGFNIKIGENKISLDSEGKIILKSGNASIIEQENSIKLIKDGSAEYSAVKAEELINIINDFCTDLISISASMQITPFTSHLTGPLMDAATKMQAKIQNIKSDFIKIS